MSDTTVEGLAAEQRTNGHSRTIEVQNPATGEVIASVPALEPADVAAVVARARAAQPGWEALGFEGRARILKRAQKWVIDNADRISRTIVAENGKAYEDAQLAEVSYAASSFGFWAKNAPKYLADERIRSSSPFVMGRKLVVRYEPVGVAGVIGPWNYPLTNSFGDCIPALAAGNSAVLKPASLTPLTSLLMAEGLRECGLPEDVFIVAPGGGSVGEALIDEVDFVMFTGSTEVGKKVMARAAQTLTPVGLELGGKDPMIVLADANLERAANAAVHYSMQNGGQTCISVERVYVEDPVYDQFVAKVEEKLRQLRQGAPGGPGIRGHRRGDLAAADGPDRLARARRRGQGRPRRRGRPQGPGPGRLLRAHPAARRGPHDGVHDRGDLRADAAGDEGGGRGRGGAAGQRLALRPPGLGVDQGHRQGRAPGPQDRGRGVLRERRPDQLRGPRAADGRLEGVRARVPPRGGRHPQVHAEAVDPGHAVRARTGTSTCSRTRPAPRS